MAKNVRPSRLARALQLLLFATLAAGCASRSPIADVAVADAFVHDGRGASPVVASVMIRNGRIQAVGKSAKAVTTIDGRGLHLLPGLIDMHVHIAAVEGATVPAAAFLDRGITTVRDLGGFAEQISAASSAGGLRIYSSVATLNASAMAPFHRVVDSPEAARLQVDEAARAGAALIKVHRALSPTVLPAVIDAAHRRGLKVTGHIPLRLHPLRACEMGMDGIEHVGSLVEAYTSAVEGAKQADAVRYLLSDEAEPLYRCLRERRVTVTPTLVLYASIARARAGGAAIPQEFREFIESMQAITLKLHQAGVVLLAGSDASGLDRPAVEPGASLFEEMALLRGAGIGSHEVLRIVGANAALNLGVAADGRLITIGQRADLLLLSSDPRTDPHAMERPLRIFVAGREHPQATQARGE